MPSTAAFVPTAADLREVAGFRQRARLAQLPSSSEDVAGVDAYRHGWLLLRGRVRSGRVVADPRVIAAPTFAEVLRAAADVGTLGVDMPIGLLDDHAPGGRRCDALARLFLGYPRGCSVFSAPPRRVLHEVEYAHAKALVPLTKQSFAILPRIREVDESITPARQAAVFEIHPEVSFAMLAGTPMALSKHDAAGTIQRFRALASVIANTERLLDRRPRGASAHDLLDALAALVSAARLATGRGDRLPARPTCDSKGLRMEVCA